MLCSGTWSVLQTDPIYQVWLPTHSDDVSGYIHILHNNIIKILTNVSTNEILLLEKVFEVNIYFSQITERRAGPLSQLGQRRASSLNDSACSLENNSPAEQGVWFVCISSKYSIKGNVLYTLEQHYTITKAYYML